MTAFAQKDEQLGKLWSLEINMCKFKVEAFFKIDFLPLRIIRIQRRNRLSLHQVQASTGA